ncbi:hypothetical protein C7B77_28345 [Chamaesiphon polymorphus CCALA 037]|uniref:Uncharacterized protein n=1 Tax=Chamaesiphon polymorphus CCALA 037 TaxID=2107692 RepID=A0A2T1F616_9CYAN|nr:hypothetical protein C7B77_28345 [Chamaesiphon polymorphus CCALA 037]
MGIAHQLGFKHYLFNKYLLLPTYSIGLSIQVYLSCGVVLTHPALRAPLQGGDFQSGFPCLVPG